MRLQLIFNPAAGPNRRAAWLLPLLQRFAARQAPRVELAVTRAPGHATELASEAVRHGCTAAVAIGGDGTANEVAQALVGTECALGLVPRGSGNGLARHLGIPLDVPGALQLLAEPNAVRRRIDTGTANGRLFLNVCGCGYDAEIARRFSSSTRRGFLGYAQLCATAWRELRAQPVEIETGDTRVALDALLVAVANSPQYGNNAAIAPGACVDDGQLDLIAVKRLHPLRAAWLATHLFRGDFDRQPPVRRIAGTDFLLRRPAPGYFHTDGEPHLGPAEVCITLRARSLLVLAPSA